MAITLTQFRASLGKLAEGLSDEEVQKKLDFAYQFSEGLYDWFKERKGTGIEGITGAYIGDMRADMVRDIERIRETKTGVHLLPQADAEIIKMAKQNEKRYPHK